MPFIIVVLLLTVFCLFMLFVFSENAGMGKCMTIVIPAEKMSDHLELCIRNLVGESKSLAKIRNLEIILVYPEDENRLHTLCDDLTDKFRDIVYCCSRENLEEQIYSLRCKCRRNTL